MNVHQSDGRIIKTFFVGENIQIKMIGSFVDDVGTRGPVD